MNDMVIDIFVTWFHISWNISIVISVSVDAVLLDCIALSLSLSPEHLDETTKIWRTLRSQNMVLSFGVSQDWDESVPVRAIHTGLERSPRS